jgi:hypothetical protein
VNDHIVTRDPIYWCGNLVLVARLQAVENAKNFGCVATGAGGVGQDEADSLLGVDDED